MAFCRACNRETAPYGELLPSGMVNRCGHQDCLMPIDGSRLPSPREGSVGEDPRAPAEPIAPRPAPVRVPAPVDEPGADADNLFGHLANARAPGLAAQRPPARAPSAGTPGVPARLPTSQPGGDGLPLLVAPSAVGAPPRSLAELLPELRRRRQVVGELLAGMAELQRERTTLDQLLACCEQVPEAR